MSGNHLIGMLDNALQASTPQVNMEVVRTEQIN
jgi:hypothetical protein